MNKSSIINFFRHIYYIFMTHPKYLFFRMVGGIFILLGSVGTWIFPIKTLAEEGEYQFDPNDIPARTGLGTNDLELIVIDLITWLLLVLGLILFVFIIYGGILWMTAGGSPEGVKKAQSILRNAIIGLLIILASYGIAKYIFEAVQTATNSGA